MELDNLKSIWKEADNRSTTPGRNQSRAVWDRRGMDQLLGKPSMGPVARMKRNLFIELLLVIVSYSSVIILFLVYRGGWLQEISWAYFFLGLLFFAYYFSKNKLLNEMQCVTCQVKANLQRQVRALEKFVRRYLFFGTLVFPVLMLFMAWLFYIKVPPVLNQSIIPTWYYWLILFVTAAMYFVNRIYLYRLYGRHIQRLKELVNEMEEE
jgi:hypothetical protein